MAAYTYDEIRARGKCRNCDWHVTGDMWRVEDRADDHEHETNHTHSVEVKELS